MDMLQVLKDRGGFSIDEQGASPKAGYMVALPEHEQQVAIDQLSAREALRIMHKYLSKLAQDHYFGGWLDNGVIYFDISQNVKVLQDAIKLGKERDQIAIWDIDNACEIRL